MAHFHASRKDIDGVLLAMVSEVMLVCAVALAFFVQIELPVTIATAAALAVLFLGSLSCWKSQATAMGILGVSLLSVQGMLILRFPMLLFPFALADVMLLIVVSGAWQTGEKRS